MSALTPTPIISDPAIFTMRSIGDDLALYISDAEILVSSKSNPNGFRQVNLLDNSCTCEAGAHGLDHCHHRATAKVAAELERRESRPVQPEYVEYPSPTAELASISVDHTPCGKCRWETYSGRCNREATTTVEVHDHHGTHEARYCDEHAKAFSPDGLPRGFVR